MILDGVSLVAAPCVSALIGIQVKMPDDFTLGRFTLASMMGLSSMTFFSIRLHSDLLNSRMSIPVLGTMPVFEVLIFHFLPMVCLLLLLAGIADKVKGAHTRAFAVAVVLALGLFIAGSAVLSPQNALLSAEQPT